jgi:PhzF family phenazine biosynthesis protein
MEYVDKAKKNYIGGVSVKKLSFKKIDAFTKGISSGNPAGYVLMENGELIDEYEMQKLASELKGFVNEVGFVSEFEDGYKLKFYSSECEVEFCGHATIAIMYDLLSMNKDLRLKSNIDIHVNAGKLVAYNYLDEQDAVYIMAPAAKKYEVNLSNSKILNALGLQEAEYDDTFPIKKINGGLSTLIVPVKTLEACLEVYPNEEDLKDFCLKNEIDIILVFTKETYNNSSDYRTRVFAPKFGYLEDPATGSGNSAFGYYLMELEMWSEDILIEQSSNKENANFVKLKSTVNEGLTHILFGGCATTRIEGKYYLHI